MKNTLIIILLALTLQSEAQNFLSYSDKNYKKEVQTVLLNPIDVPLGKPIIYINEMENQLHLQFDVLATEAPYLYYTFIHCTNDWKPSDIQPIEYIDGFFSDDIEKFVFSLNTMVDYVHYDLKFPSSDMMPKLSGNYLLVVYGDDNLTADNLYFTRRFMIVDEAADVRVKIPRYPFDLNLGSNKQQVDLEVSYPDLFNSLASQYSNVTIQQNGRWDNAVIGLKPTYVYPESLSYLNNPKTVFESGNQFRHFNTSNLYNRPEKTETVIKGANCYVVTLYPDQKRNSHNYIEEEDLYGNKYIYLERDGFDPAQEADYVMVDFFLDWNPVMTHEDVYIMGAITDWNLDEKNKMEYDFQRKGYKISLLLKQGYYDYIYAVRERGQKAAQVGTVAGDFWETVNEYTVYVYLFDQINNYDRLIGVTTIKSH